MPVCRIDYCQFILTSQTNFTMTQFADHRHGFSHDAVKRYLQGDKLTANQVWEHSKRDIVVCARGCIVCDDTLSTRIIRTILNWFDGNTVERPRPDKCIGLVNCINVNPEQDGKTKLDHVRDMLLSAVANKGLYQVKRRWLSETCQELRSPALAMAFA
jgi:uncharacterized Fe-S center protein